MEFIWSQVAKMFEMSAWDNQCAIFPWLDSELPWNPMDRLCLLNSQAPSGNVLGSVPDATQPSAGVSGGFADVFTGQTNASGSASPWPSDSPTIVARLASPDIGAATLRKGLPAGDMHTQFRF